MPPLNAQLVHQARITRRVTVGTDLGVTVEDLVAEDEPWFKCRLVLVRDEPSDEDGSPRSLPRMKLRYSSGFLRPSEALGAGYRVEIRSGRVLELLGRPRTLLHGSAPAGQQAQVQDISTLYPLASSITGAGGDPVHAEDVPTALWMDDETMSDRGDYETYSGEVPIEFHSHFDAANCQLVIGGDVFKITRAVIKHRGPRVALTLRKS